MRKTMIKENNNVHYLPENFEEDAREFLGLSGDYSCDCEYFEGRRGTITSTFGVTKDQELVVSFSGYENYQRRLVVDSVTAYSIMK